jgi:YbgC/YbaW family acyl-CoA thioester hydrolase
LVELGYDPKLFWEQQIVWGDHDSFQHVNNVRYVRFVESARIHFLSQLGLRIGGESKAADMRNGKGISLILKSITVDYKRPVTYPDTLLMATMPSLIYPEGSEPSKGSPSRTTFSLNTVAYSYAQQSIVTKARDVTVWYDYSKQKKCDPGDEYWGVLQDMIARQTSS